MGRLAAMFEHEDEAGQVHILDGGGTLLTP